VNSGYEKWQMWHFILCQEWNAIIRDGAGCPGTLLKILDIIKNVSCYHLSQIAHRIAYIVASFFKKINVARTPHFSYFSLLL
jgi:hypothetical protein